MFVVGHLTADTISASSHATHKTKWPPTVPCLQTSSLTAHAARLRSIRCRRNQGVRVKNPSRTATSHAIRCWLVVICARTSVTQSLARLAPSTSTSPAGAGEQRPSLSVTKGALSTRTVSASAEPSLTADATSAESAAALARRRRPSGGSRSGAPTTTTNRSISACRCAAASSSAAGTLANNYATKGPVCHARRPSSTRSAALVDGQSSSHRSHAGRGRRSADSHAREPVHAAIRPLSTIATPTRHPALSAPS
jgi:hypothetical protein